MLNLYWPYATVNSISDQIWFIRRLCADHSIPFTISHQLDPISHNLVLENLNDESTNYIERFCNKHALLVSVVVTEFLAPGPGKDELYVNGELLHVSREYNPELRHRFDNLLKIARHIHSFVSLGGQPRAESYCEIFGIEHWADFEVPNVEFLPLPVAGKRYDLHFSGSLTSFRKDVLRNLEHTGFSLLVESRFVSEDIRRSQLSQCAFNLNIPQSMNWPWLSTMRVLFGVRNRAFTAQTTQPPDVPLAEFVLQFTDRNSLYDEFDKKCQHLKYLAQSSPVAPAAKSRFLEFLELISQPTSESRIPPRSNAY